MYTLIMGSIIKCINEPTFLRLLKNNPLKYFYVFLFKKSQFIIKNTKINAGILSQKLGKYFIPQ